MSPDEFVKKFNWSLETLMVARRSHFRCVYCNHYFFQSVDSWVLFNVDHLRPGVSGERDEQIENKVAACWPCNKLKSTFDPGSGNESATIAQLIEIAKKHIDEVRNRRKAKVAAMHEAVSKLQES